MSNNIMHYSYIEAQDDPFMDQELPGPSHAKLHGSDTCLCGYSGEICFIGSLADVDGYVSCEECMSALHKLAIPGTYGGPLEFVADVKEVDGILLQGFGWTTFDSTCEHFFAYGHHESGVVLEIARKISGNKLIGWEEVKTTIYAHWENSTYLNQNEPLFCYRVWNPQAQPYDTNTLKVTAYDATLIRFEAWPLLRQGGMTAEYHCRWIRAWFEGTTKLGRPATPGDMLDWYHPGFAIEGIPSGQEQSSYLRWPTSDLDEALQQMKELQRAGATDLCIVNQGTGYPLEMLTPKVVSLFKLGSQVHGSSHPVLDFLENGVDL